MSKTYFAVKRILAALILASLVFCTLGCTYVHMPEVSISGEVPEVTPASPDDDVDTSPVITEPETE